jgi:hypothetical protein
MRETKFDEGCKRKSLARFLSVDLRLQVSGGQWKLRRFQSDVDVVFLSSEVFFNFNGNAALSK